MTSPLCIAKISKRGSLAKTTFRKAVLAMNDKKNDDLDQFAWVKSFFFSSRYLMPIGASAFSGNFTCKFYTNKLCVVKSNSHRKALHQMVCTVKLCVHLRVVNN